MRAMLIFAAVFSQVAFAQKGPAETANEFHRLFMQSLPQSVRQQPGAQLLHLTPDANLVEAWNANSIQEAMSIAARSNIENLVQTTPADSTAGPDVNAILKRKPLTVVLVPGIFGEFIKTRAYEDILGKPSSWETEYKKIVSDALRRADRNAVDLSYDMDALRAKPLGMDTLVQASSIDDENGKPLVKVVLMFTPAGSTETLGPLNNRAQMMNRRLSKYLALTGEQDLVVVGYSRGTTYALDMLAKAKSQNLPWLKNVKGMVALSGVVWGSTSADETVNPNAPVYHTVQATQKLFDELQVTDQMSWGAQRVARAKNTLAWGRFFNTLRQHSDSSMFSFENIRTGLTEGPLRAALGIKMIGSMYFLVEQLTKLGLENPTDYDDNVRRGKVLVTAALKGVSQLRTDERIKWWQTTVLPTSLTYYSITAAMANPKDSEVSKQSFENPLAYANRAFEDMFLLQNRDEYVKVSGVKLNDSQVAIPQAMFLPNAIQKLNPAQEPIKTKFLGTLGTHHWGAALRIVFEMRDSRVNQYPRESLLKAMAAQVILDQESNR